jgi:hypothetical protein
MIDHLNTHQGMLCDSILFSGLRFVHALRHMDKQKQATIWADLMMLANADCIVLSASGFSYAALWVGNTTCMVTVHDCLKSTENYFKNIPV